MQVGGYTLDLYCDNVMPYPDPNHEPDEFPKQYFSEFGSDCRHQARKDGWILGHNNKAICPKCAHKKQKKAPHA